MSNFDVSGQWTLSQGNGIAVTAEFGANWHRSDRLGGVLGYEWHRCWHNEPWFFLHQHQMDGRKIRRI